ncbi:MAG: hypothetical protein Kow00104_12870 [Rhodothalassiaceae bacterium]
MRSVLIERLGRAPRRPQRSDYDLVPRAALRPRPARSLRRAAVLVPLLMRGEGMTVLLTCRAAHLSRHPGQISFPGGRADPQDTNAVSTALREAEEEVGLPPDAVEIVGRLDSYETVTGYRIVPVVGLIDRPPPFRPDPGEVAEIFELPLDFVCDPANHRLESRTVGGIERHYYVLPWKDRYIWGATAHMLVNLGEALAASGSGEGE